MRDRREPLKALPPESPLPMPRASLHGTRHGSREFRSREQSVGTWAARIYMVAFVGLLGGYGVDSMYRVVSSVEPPVVLQWLFLVLFAISFAWICVAFGQASLGFIRLLAPGRRAFRGSPDDRLPRTAVLIPAYNEDPQRIGAGILAASAGLARAAPGRFAFFVLSDSRDPAAWVAEEQVFQHLHRQAPAGCPCYYRHRADNVEKKAGNIADWVERFGGAYDAMIVLDADSVMAPETMISLARRLGADPGVGLIQTLPLLVRGRTLFARLQQFASFCYGPVHARGLSLWAGASGNFWGHNAILRIEAFASACRLPHLAGQPPLGGHVLSHDFVEAALMRRAGWGVLFHSDLAGSYEESPVSLMDATERDRRWCQGNLQHARLLRAQGLRMPSRLHMLTGIMSYLSAPVWLLLVVVGLALSLQAHLVEYEYFTGPSLFPRWPVFEAERALTLLALSIVVLLGPKLLGWLHVMLSPRLAAGFGGRRSLTLSMLTETVCSALYAPVIMISHCMIVVQVLRGDDCGWVVLRDRRGQVPWSEHWRRYWPQVVTGSCTAALAGYLSLHVFLWLLPFTLGLMLAPMLSRWSESPPTARRVASLGLLRTPAEGAAPLAVRSMERSLAEIPPPHRANPLRVLAGDADLCRWHLAQLPPPSAAPGDLDEDHVVALAKADRSGDDLDRLESWLTPVQMLTLLQDADFVRRLVPIRPPDLEIQSR